jgi:integrase
VHRHIRGAELRAEVVAVLAEATGDFPGLVQMLVRRCPVIVPRCRDRKDQVERPAQGQVFGRWLPLGPRRTTRRGQSWDVDEARTFLEPAYADRDPLYPLWVLILVLGLRKGEAQGLVWPSVDPDNAEISLKWQVQRVGRQLIHKQHLKTDGSTDVLPLPDI